ncbi:para-aminobenzoate synthase [Nadsonia fulvescens var. elongata DSM 6958]|uniref:aminodeoxychorismate synthase n=1 Tax=Nadsonia fulvescens var. elongata DSM 6958 TaxID=857566 RepID=A0A1E3PPS6_9ASCO|nr:para-aminobenzoate synthase [Nadsonia fulvescens var. elongata DSM 6958]
MKNNIEMTAGQSPRNALIGGKILLIDSYDSFSFNLSTQIRNVTGAEVTTIHNDSMSSKELIDDYLPYFDAVVVGPGPGHPSIASDVGVLPDLWQLSADQIIPIFGVCLGFQSMCLANGSQVVRLSDVKHGQKAIIEHSSQDIFAGIPDRFESVRYHSLHILLADESENTDIVPLAWTNDPDNTPHTQVLMAGKHASKPYWGVQYHPESICSSNGEDVLSNFWKMAQAWSRDNNRKTKYNQAATRKLSEKYSIKPRAYIASKKIQDPPATVNFERLNFDASIFKNEEYPEVSIIIGDLLRKNKVEFTLLNSASVPGRWSIIGIVEPNSTNCITYYTGTSPDQVFLKKWGQAKNEKDGVDLDQDGIWGYLARYMAPKIEQFKNAVGPPDSPFLGGLVGYFSYESGESCYSDKLINTTPIDKPYPDVNLVDIERTILFDALTNSLYLVSIKENDHAWIKETARLIQTEVLDPTKNHKSFIDSIPFSCSAYLDGVKPQYKLPEKQSYIDKIKKAQEYLRSGDSYELCVTAQTTIKTSRSLDPWDLYKTLYIRNPAPYSCFLNLQHASLVGASPERFVSWNKQGICEFRPIKGTVRNTPEVTREMAERILSTPKELAENLMIVDLIRHDLNQLLENVSVKKLMGIEEYKTVYQLVSVISGQLVGDYSGIDVLAHSLPPGSMTGAPKIRSVEILHELEDYKRRGIYSGVCGYWSVHDEADWSVVIRSAFNYHDEKALWSTEEDNDGNTMPHTKNDHLCDVWRIGAGGAITVLSDPENEWDEMIVKLESALQAFL